MVRRFRALGWGPAEGGGNHPVMWKAGRKIVLPNPHKGDIDWSLAKRISTKPASAGTSGTNCEPRMKAGTKQPRSLWWFEPGWSFRPRLNIEATGKKPFECGIAGKVSAAAVADFLRATFPELAVEEKN